MEQLKEVLEKIAINTKSSAKSNKATADWAMFRGIVTILGLVGLVLGVVYQLNQ